MSGRDSGISILASCTSGGCGAKLGPAELTGLLSGLPVYRNPRLRVGYDSSDDAAAYELGDTCIISTADFFSPMVDEPYAFGKIAAANALSDVYAMGGQPVMALNLTCFPETMPLSVLAEILRGGAEKLIEAGAALAGGHTVYDKEIKYGLAVTGIVPAAGILRNNTPRPGDRLILTKALGTGIIMSALRAGAADDASVMAAVSSMERLNMYAAKKLIHADVSACTDITGFGLVGHALEMAGETTGLVIDPAALPFLPNALEYAGDYMITAAGQRNRLHAKARGVDAEGLGFALQELVFDPQTSGGLLIAVSDKDADGLLAAIKKEDGASAIIGRVTNRNGTALTFGGI